MNIRLRGRTAAERTETATGASQCACATGPLHIPRHLSDVLSMPTILIKLKSEKNKFHHLNHIKIKEKQIVSCSRGKWRETDCLINVQGWPVRLYHEFRIGFKTME